MSYIQDIRALVGHRPLILAGAAVMVFDGDNKLLLQYRRDENKWDIPGGFMEIGETTEETARREVREETGLEIGEMTLFNICSGKELFYVCPNGDQVFPVFPVYITNDVRGDLHADGDEVREVRYFPIDELPEQMLPETKRIIESYIKATCCVRTQCKDEAVKS